MTSFLTGLLGALALVSPVDCAGCGWPDVELCPGCRERLRPAPLRSTLPGGVPLVSGAVYAGVLRDVVLAFKQEGRWRLARELGPCLRAAIESVPDRAGPHTVDSGAVLLVGVPPSRAGLRRRGYDPVELLTRAAGGVATKRALRIRHSLGSRSGGSQKSRSRHERLAARQGTLRASNALRGRAVVLVDDVVTSGSTLVEAVRAVEAVGAHVVSTCCLAATPLISEAKP